MTPVAGSRGSSNQASHEDEATKKHYVTAGLSEEAVGKSAREYEEEKKK